MNTAVTSKKVYIEVYGCQMNVYDTELVRSILTKANYTFVPTENEADIVLLNTCAIREHAHSKVYNRAHDIHHARNGNPVMVGILGCMATNLRQELFENRKLKIDFIAGPDSYKRLPDLIRDAAETGKKQYDLTLSEFETYSNVFPAQQQGGNPSTRPDVKGGHSLRVNAWIAVMRGCNNFCTFCVVPYTRGRERSRSVDNILEEVKKLAADGFQQVTLLGQNVNSYRHDHDDFADLMEAVSKVEGIERIRFTSPHPKDFPDKLLDVVAYNPKVCKHIHLPLQSGNDRILDLMNRTYTQDEFLRLVDKIRGKCPSMVLTTDIIVGFSSETDEKFADTLKVMTEVEFDSAFIFKYSERKGTIAERKHPDDVPQAIKTERIVRLNERQKEISLKKNLAHVGEIQQTLIEHAPSDKSPDKAAGRTDGNKLVLINRDRHQQGDWVKVKITGASPNNLKGIAI